MIGNQNSYQITIDKIAELRRYLLLIRAFPVEDKTIQEATENGINSMIESMENECVEFIQTMGEG